MGYEINKPRSAEEIVQYLETSFQPVATAILDAEKSGKSPGRLLVWFGNLVRKEITDPEQAVTTVLQFAHRAGNVTPVSEGYEAAILNSFAFEDVSYDSGYKDLLDAGEEEKAQALLTKLGTHRRKELLDLYFDKFYPVNPNNNS